MSEHPCPIFTIGHSTYPVEVFVERLKEHWIEAVADVRSSPYSQYNPQYNRETLKATLQAQGIEYVFLGEELGARRSERECYVNGQVVYERVARMPAFQAGTERLKKGAEKMRIVLMCAEKDPLGCHRTILVSRHLVRKGLQVSHILEDGSLEKHEETEDRLLETLRMSTPDLFRSREEILDEAYERQGKKIAYTEEKEGEDGAD